MNGVQLSAAECKVRVGKTGGPCVRVAGHGDVSPYEVVHVDEYGQRAISAEHPTRQGDGTPTAIDGPALFDIEPPVRELLSNATDSERP